MEWPWHGRHPRGEVADLAGADDEDLVLDGPGPQQELPVGRAGGRGEGGRHGHHRGPEEGHDPVELGEAEVVAEGHPEHRGRAVRAGLPAQRGHAQRVPGAMVADSRKLVPSRVTSNRWIFR